MSERTASPGTLAGHTVICNWNDLGDQIVRELHASVVRDHRPIVIVTQKPETVPAGVGVSGACDPYQGVFVVPGDPTSEIVLARADIEHANTAIVLSDPEEGNRADTKSVLIALAVEAIQPRVHTIVELLHSRNRIHFRHTYVDEIVCMDELTEKLLAQSALTHGVSEFYIRLLTATEDTNEVYVIAVPGPFVGRTYRELERALIEFDEENVILVGVQTVETRLDGEREVTNHFGRRLQERVLTINPPSQSELEQREDLRQCRLKHRDYVLQASDKLFLIAYCPPVLDGLAPS